MTDEIRKEKSKPLSMSELQIDAKKRKGSGLEELQKGSKDGIKSVAGTKQTAESSVTDLLTKVKFLSDKPLAADYEQNDRFGHSGIAENLKQIILICPVPFTIGLFGKWGTGKTSILNILKDKLAAVHKVPVVTFDVWKHKGDALRRTFLKELVKELKEQGLIKKYKLSEQVDKSIGIKKTFEKLNIFNCVTTYILFGLIILFGGILYWADISIFKNYLSIVTSSSLVVALIIFLIQRMVVTEDITKTASRFEDPHQFEGEFFNIMKATKAERVLIAVDNLDRCTHNKAVELLSTIKTFLAKDSDTETNNNCIFLITCDDGAIKEHLKTVYRDTKDFLGADEFLRKFFNTFVHLPDFIDRELQDYTEELLKQTGIPQFDDPDVGHVITIAFRDNPRQIKQFINILIAHFLMAQNRESGEERLIISKGTITNNVAFLAKFLIIRQKFPSLYDQIKQDYLTRAESRFLIDKAENNDFLRATKDIVVSNIKPFIYLKQSADELALPGIIEIEEGLVGNNPEIVKEKLTIIKEETQKTIRFSKFLLTLIHRNRQRPQILINIITCSLDVLNDLKLELSKQFYKRTGHLLNDNDNLKNDLYKFNPSLVFNEILTRCNEGDRRGILAQYVTYISHPRHEDDETRVDVDTKAGKTFIGRDYAYDLLEEFVKNKRWLNNNEKTRIRKAIENTYYDDIEVLSLFEDNIENQKDFVSEETVSKFVSTFSDDDVEDIKSIAGKIQLFLKFKGVIGLKATGTILNKLEELLEAENKIPLEPTEEDEIGRKENLLNRIEDILITLKDEIKNKTLQGQLNSFTDKLCQGTDSLPNWNDRKILVFSFLLVVDLLDGPNKAKVDQLMQKFFSKADLGSVQFVFGNKRLSKNKQTQLIGQYPDIFQQRAISEQSIFNYLYPIASKETRPDWFVNLINSNYQQALQKLEELEYRTDDNKKVVEALLEKVSSIVVQEKNSIYAAINEMKCADSLELKSALVEQIKPLLNNTDSEHQRVGYNALEGSISFLPAPKRREIGTEIIEWLRSVPLPNAGQSDSVKSILLVWDDLSDTKQRDYIDFVSDRLIVRGANLNNVNLGIEILIKLNPNYESYNKQYDDILDRFEGETNVDIKKAINEGLLNLKPEKSTKESKNFWSKIQKWNADSDEE